jgi:hypothetical protein
MSLETFWFSDDDRFGTQRPKCTVILAAPITILCLFLLSHRRARANLTPMLDRVFHRKLINMRLCPCVAWGVGQDGAQVPLEHHGFGQNVLDDPRQIVHPLRPRLRRELNP